MKVGSYTLTQTQRLEALGATFVRKKDALLLARLGEEGFELELLDVPGFKSVRREAVGRVATVTRVGQQKAVFMRPAESGAKGDKKYSRTFEVRVIDNFSVKATFTEEKPGAVAGSPDGKLIAVAHDSGGLNVWDADTGKLASEYAAKGIGAVEFSPDGAVLAAREFAGVLAVLDGRRPTKPLRTVKIKSEGQIAFHPKQHLVALPDPSGINVVDVEAGKVTATIKAGKRKSKDPIGPVAYSPDGKLLVSATSTDGIISLWDMEKAEFIGDALELNAPMNRVEFDATGKFLLLSSFEGVEVHSIAK